ncbi:MAG: hypothetical protein JWO19_5728 [Bryobacterales bacterium]|nr:hypothetical protein [Bryobacterales bacterium]
MRAELNRHHLRLAINSGSTFLSIFSKRPFYGLSCARITYALMPRPFLTSTCCAVRPARVCNEVDVLASCGGDLGSSRLDNVVR